MEPITTHTGTAVSVPIDNIDTDQIIPARYLKATDKVGMGDALFADWRYDADGNPIDDFPLNRPEAQGATLLIAGHNFGCGSSREHAVWALQGFGLKVVISTAFANIFYNNALKAGLLPIQVDDETYHQLRSLCEEEPSSRLEVDLMNQSLILPGGQSVSFPIDGFAKHCLLNGVDQLGFILSEEEAISAFEETHGRRVDTTR